MTQPVDTGPKRVLLSWSSGKDSAWTLYQLQQDPSVEVVGLLTTFNSQFNRSAIHGVRQQLLQLQAQAAGLPLFEIALPWPCSNEQYETIMGEALEDARSQFAMDAVAFGDLYLEDIRAYREQQMADTGLELLFPLWQIPTEQLAQQMIVGGLKAAMAGGAKCTLRRKPRVLTAFSFAPTRLDGCSARSTPLPTATAPTSDRY